MAKVISVNIAVPRHNPAKGVGITGIDKQPAAGDPITVLSRPAHDVTVGMTFRATTLEPELLPRLLVADALPQEVKDRARRRIASASEG